MSGRLRSTIYLFIVILSLAMTPTLVMPLQAQGEKQQARFAAASTSRESGKGDLRRRAGNAVAGGGQGQDVARARAALDQGKRLLRRNQADQAFGYLETARGLFEQSGDGQGRAAAEDALGDIYARQGQYNIALRHYQSACETFEARKEATNADLELLKIGETYFRLGKVSEAQLAFAKISEKRKSSSAPGALLQGVKGQDVLSGAASGASSAAAQGGGAANQAGVMTQVMPGASSFGLSCPFLNSKVPSIPNQGVAARKPDDLGRVDLRVTDPEGNPVKGVKARLESHRPNGLQCENEGLTDALGRLLMYPLHINNATLSVRAGGFQPLKMNVDPESLGQPLRVVLQPERAVAAQSTAEMLGACSEVYKQLVTRSSTLLGAGRAALLSNQLATAKELFQNALNPPANNLALGNLGFSRRVRAAARTSLGDIAFREGRYADALKLYQEAIDGARTDNRLDLVWAAQRGRGKTYWTLGRAEKDAAQAAKLRADAIGSYREAIKTIETIRAGSLRADEARTSFVATTGDVFDEASALLAETALAESPANPLGGSGLTRAAEAFAIVEQGRARALLDLMEEGRVRITEGVPADLLKQKEDNIARQGEIAEKLTGLALTGNPPKSAFVDLENELDRLALDYNTIENIICAKSPRYASLTTIKPLSLTEIQRQLLDDKTVLLAYSLGPEGSYLYAATRATLNLYRLPARPVLDQLALEFRSQLLQLPDTGPKAGAEKSADAAQRGLQVKSASASSGVKAYAAAAYALYHAAVEPAAPAIGDKRLVIIADGALHFVPFEPLVTDAAAAAAGGSYAGLPFLIKTNEVMYAPSGSVIAAGRDNAPGVSTSNMLIVADPVFDVSDPRAKGASKSPGGPGSPGEKLRGLALKSAAEDVKGARPSGRASANWGIARLDATRAEAGQIARLAGASRGRVDVWLDLEASETNVKKRDLAAYGFLHFATHGFLSAERPQLSGLVLSLVGEDEGDGFLRVPEVFNLRLGAPLVILSACETGLGQVRHGEGVIGLTRAFMYAGAPTVGVSLWSVNDDSTAELMTDFYTGLLQGRGPAGAALRAAQLKMIAAGRYDAPYFWAPFVLVGDWR